MYVYEHLFRPYTAYNIVQDLEPLTHGVYAKWPDGHHVNYVVVLTLAHRYNAVRGHSTGSNNVPSMLANRTEHHVVLFSNSSYISALLFVSC